MVQYKDTKNKKRRIRPSVSPRTTLGCRVPGAGTGSVVAVFLRVFFVVVFVRSAISHIIASFIVIFHIFFSLCCYLLETNLRGLSRLIDNTSPDSLLYLLPSTTK